MGILLFLLANLPAILNAIIGIENAIKAPGATKKQLVMQSLGIAAQAGEKISEKHVQAVSALIDSTVSTLNTSGIFTKSPVVSVDVPNQK